MRVLKVVGRRRRALPQHQRVVVASWQRRPAPPGLQTFSHPLFRSSSSSSSSSSSLTTRRESLPDVRGMPVVTSSWKCLEHLDMAVWDYARWSGDVLESARAAAAADPDCVLAHCVLALQLLAHGGAAATHPEVLAAMRANRRLLKLSCPGAEREAVHAAAVEAWADPVAKGGPRRAAAIWEAWLLKAPRDLLALRGSHDAHLALGDGLGALESVARVRPMWNQSVFGYSQVLSMHAMALTEASAGSYLAAAGDAEEIARAAHGADKRDAWALHALCHVLDHGGRASEGASLLRHSRDFWEALPNVGAAVHFGAHLARFYLERGNYKAALRTVDTTVLEPIHNVGARATLGLTPGSDPFDEDAFDRTRLDYLRLAATTASSQQHLVTDGSSGGGSSTGSTAPPGDDKGGGDGSGQGAQHGEHDEYVQYDDEMFERLRFPPPAALLDATSVLWRLELNGIAASFRWLKLADHWDCVAPGLGFGSGGGGDGFDDLHLRYGQDHRRAAVWAYGEEASAASSSAAARQRALRRSHQQQQQEGFAAASSSSDSDGPRPFTSFSTELIHQLTPLQAVHRTMNAVACAELLKQTTTDDDDEYYDHEFSSGGGYGSGLDDMIAPTPSIFSSLRELVSPSDGAKTMALSSGSSSSAAVAAIDAGSSALSKSGGGESNAALERVRAAAVEAEDEEAESFDYMPDLEVERLRRLDDKASEEAAAVALAIAQGEDPSSSALVAVPLDASYLPVDVLDDVLGSAADDADDYVGEGGSGRGIEWLFQDDPTTREPPIAPAAPFCSNPVTGLRIWQHGRAPATGSAEAGATRMRLPVPSLDRVSRAVAQEAAVGAVAFWHRDLVTSIDTLLPLKPQLQVLGGSCLERETILLTLLEAAVRSSAPRKPESLLPSGEERDETHEQTFRSFVATASPGEEADIGSDHASIGVGAYVHPDDRSEAEDQANLPPTGVTGLALARALLAERTALKTGSAQAWVRYAVVLERLGDHASADTARRTAYALGIGQGGAGAN